MTSIGAIGASASTSSPATGQANGLQSLINPNTFLQLLVAQLKYQNPLNPTSGTQFLSQTAQLSEVEAIQSMSTQITSMSAQMTRQVSAVNMLSSASLIGKQVTARSSSGSTIQGTVTAVDMTGSGSPLLTVGSTQVPLSSISTIT